MPRVLEIPDGIPYDPFRSALYTRDELMGDGLDARIELAKYFAMCDANWPTGSPG